MKRVITLIMALAIVFGSQAQIGGLVGGAVKRGIQKSVEKKVEQKMDEALGVKDNQKKEAAEPKQNDQNVSATTEEDGDHIPTPEEVMIRMQRDAALKQVVSELKEPYRRIVEMRYYEDLSYEEIAERLRLPLGTVKVRLSRAKALLSSMIKDKDL